MSGGAEALRRVAAGTLWLWLRLVVTLGAMVLATRFALQALGVEAFGVFAAVAGVPLILGC